jgi:hypothetical protein
MMIVAAMRSMTLRKGDAHEQYYLSRRLGRDRPRDLGLFGIALTRREVPRIDPPPAHPCAGGLARIWPHPPSSKPGSDRPRRVDRCADAATS